MKLGARKYTDLIDIYSYWTYPKYLLTRTKNLESAIFFQKKNSLYHLRILFFFFKFELWRENIYVITE